MTLRAVAPQASGPPDFTRLTNMEARRRVAQLLAMGMPESQIGSLFGWSVNDVRRALTPRPTQART
jgi:hypothetical protein